MDYFTTVCNNFLDIFFKVCFTQKLLLDSKSNKNKKAN